MANTTTIISLIGFYDNFGEAEPVWNYRETMIGLAVPFLVRTSRVPIARDAQSDFGLHRLYLGSASDADCTRGGGSSTPRDGTTMP